MLIKVKAEENSKSLQDLSADAAVLYKKALRQTIHLFDREIELSKNERIWLENGIWYWGTVINNVLHVIPIQKGKIYQNMLLAYMYPDSDLAAVFDRFKAFACSEKRSPANRWETTLAIRGVYSIPIV